MIAAAGQEKADPCIAILGAGGKSGLLWRLGEEFAREYSRVLVTSLTKSEPVPDDKVVLLSDLASMDITGQFQAGRPCYLMGAEESANKLVGLTTDELHTASTQTEVCLFECDGARSLSLKAHLPHDPAVPPFATQAVIVVGADVVNTTINAGLVHRPEVFKARWTLAMNTVMDADFIATVLTEEKGYLAKVPSGIPIRYFVNKADSHPRQAGQLARALRRRFDGPVYIGSTRANSCVEWQPAIGETV